MDAGSATSASPGIRARNVTAGRRKSHECLNYPGNSTEARISYYIKVDAIPVCRRHKCKVRTNCERRRRLCENMSRLFFPRARRAVASRGFLVHTPDTCLPYVHVSHRSTRRSARATFSSTAGNVHVIPVIFT